MIFGFDKVTQTIFLYTFTMLVFFVVPATYSNINGVRLQRLQNKGLLRDWRIWVVCLVYAIIFGFRYDYMQDWSTYFEGFNRIKEGFAEWSIQREPGFFFLQYCLGSLGFSGYSIFFIQAFLWIYCICYLLKDNRKYLPFVLPFVFLGGSIGLIITRQFFAMSLMYIGYRLSLEGKNKKAWILYLLSVSVHFSALLWLIVFVLLKKIKSLNSIIVFIVFIFLTVLSSIFFDFLVQGSNMIAALITSAGITGKEYDTYAMLQMQKEATVASSRQMIILTLMRGLYLVTYFDCKRKGYLEDKVLNNLTILGVLGIFTDLIMGYNMIFARFGAYLTIFYYLGYGILAYITLVARRSHFNVLIKFGIFIVLFYYLGSLYSGVISPPVDPTINKYLIYQI